MLHREAFLEHYHRRSLLEFTVWMIKAKFGADLHNKNELLCKVLCHHIFVMIQSVCKLGIDPKFPMC